MVWQKCSGIRRSYLDLTDNTLKCSSNPPSIIYDYMTNPIYGMNIDPRLMNLDTFIEAGQYCKSMGYYANGSVSYQSTYKENIENICQAGGLTLYTYMGQICIGAVTCPQD